MNTLQSKETVRTALATLKQGLTRLEAEWLLSQALGCSRAQIYSQPEISLDTAVLTQLNDWLGQCLSGKPLAYVLGEWAFYGLTFKLNHHTLVPRPETESMVEWILNHYPDKPGFAMADLGTGSGAIACALAYHRPSWRVVATDISLPALAQASGNAKRLGLTQIEFYQGDFTRALPAGLWDGIVSNPPYLAEDDPHLAALSHEPQGALISADQGFADLHQLISRAAHHLLPKGILVVEHGYQQGLSLVQRFKTARLWTEITQHHDLSGHQRFITAHRRAKINVPQILSV